MILARVGGHRHPSAMLGSRCPVARRGEVLIGADGAAIELAHASGLMSAGMGALHPAERFLEARCHQHLASSPWACNWWDPPLEMAMESRL